MLRQLLAQLRRRFFTRCECCGLPIAGPPTALGYQEGEHWWQGERGLFHAQCLEDELAAYGWAAMEREQ
jgi:hypothetical protein